MEYKVKDNLLISVNKDIIEFDMPNNIIEIAPTVFWDCKKLKKINLSISLTHLTTSCFWNCTSLKKINIPDSVIHIKDWSFAYCKNLVSINIPKNIKTVGAKCFYDCMNLKNIDIDDINTFKNTKFSNIGSTFNKTHYDIIFRKLGDVQFKNFLYDINKNKKNALKYLGKYNIELEDILFLLDKEEYTGLTNGLNYGI